MGNIKNRIEEITTNKEKIKVYINKLEVVVEKLDKLLNELLDQQLPESSKFSNRRISNIDTLVSSITKLNELIRKYRENVHSMTLDEIEILNSIEEETNKTNIDVRSIWREVSKLTVNR